MAMSLIGLGWLHRRWRFSLPIILLTVGILVGADRAERADLTRQEWEGRVVKIYEQRRFWHRSRSHGPKTRVWDVRSEDGSLHSIKIYSPDLWSQARVGDRVVKHTGQLSPRFTRDSQ